MSNEPLQEEVAQQASEEGAGSEVKLGDRSGRVFYRLTLTQLGAVDVNLIFLSFHTYAPLSPETVVGLMEDVQSRLSAFGPEQTDQIENALALYESGEKDFRVIADRTDIGFQWLSSREQEKYIRTLYQTVHSRRSRVKKTVSAKKKSRGKKT